MKDNSTGRSFVGSTLCNRYLVCVYMCLIARRALHRSSLAFVAFDLLLHELLPFAKINYLEAWMYIVVLLLLVPFRSQIFNAFLTSFWTYSNFALF